MRQLRMSLCATSLLALAAGCSTPALDKLENTQSTQNSAFNQQLTEEYKVLAKFEADEMRDLVDAGHFAEKGLEAARNQPTLPDRVGDRDIPKADKPELVDAHARLIDAFQNDARERFPVEAAVAQAKFDCWLEQQEENYQPAHIAACRNAYRNAIRSIYSQERAYLDGQKQKTAMRSADRAADVAKARIYFDFDEATIPSDEKTKLDDLADSARDLPEGYTLIATGFADRAGSYGYNDTLSVRRADAVRKALIDRGLEPGAIVVNGKGEMEPAKPTGDGVREPQNRRVEVSVRTPPA